MPDKEDHTRPHNVQCGRCRKAVTYWGPLANKRCPRCGLVLWAGLPSDPKSDQIVNTIKGCAALVFFAFLLLLIVASCRGGATG